MTDHAYTDDIGALTVGVLGGTGAHGRGLAYRLAHAGVRVVLGSRSGERAAQAAAQLGAPGVTGAENAACARQSDVVIVAVPFDGHRELLTGLRDPLAGKIVVDCVNPIGFDKQGAFVVAVPEGSACQQAQAVLPDSIVIGAFHHVSSVVLLDAAVTEVDCDVMVVGDDRPSMDLVQALASRIPGMRGIYAGRLRNARQIEALTANLISVNRRHKTHAGIRITGV
jgi:NADPH-dependent F420 reductase